MEAKDDGLLLTPGEAALLSWFVIDGCLTTTDLPLTPPTPP
ncbi:hypothetical protein ACFQ61_08145 [Streptomyces sp. NPDC056500]